ncbi:hypothetical protein ACLK10_04965 [Escherichia coli]
MANSINMMCPNAEDADAAAEAELARQFAQTQQQRYSGERTGWGEGSRWMILNFRHQSVAG